MARFSMLIITVLFSWIVWNIVEGIAEVLSHRKKWLI